MEPGSSAVLPTAPRAAAAAGAAAPSRRVRGLPVDPTGPTSVERSALATAQRAHRGAEFAALVQSAMQGGEVPQWIDAVLMTWPARIVGCAQLAHVDGELTVTHNAQTAASAYGRGLLSLRRVLAPELPGVKCLSGAANAAYAADAYADALLAYRAAAQDPTTGVVRPEWTPLMSLLGYVESQLKQGQAAPIVPPGVQPSEGTAAAAPAAAGAGKDTAPVPAVSLDGVSLRSLLVAAWGLFWQQHLLKATLAGWVWTLLRGAAAPSQDGGKRTALCPCIDDEHLSQWRAQLLAHRAAYGSVSAFVEGLAAEDLALLAVCIKVALARAVVMGAAGVSAEQRRETLRVLGSIPLRMLVPGGAAGPHQDTLQELASFLDQMLLARSKADMLKAIVGAGGVYAAIRALVQVLGRKNVLKRFPTFDPALPDALTADNPIVQELKGTS